MDNFKIRKMRDDIIERLNTEQYPVELKRLVLSEIMAEVEKMALSQITDEMNKLNNKTMSEEGNADGILENNLEE